VHHVGAVEAAPLEPVEFADRSLVLDDKSDRIGVRPLRRMADVWRQQIHVTFLDGHVHWLGAFSGPDHQVHIALDLVKELFARIIVEVVAFVSAANDHHDHVGLAPNLLVRYRGSEVVTVISNPLVQVEGLPSKWAGWVVRCHVQVSNQDSSSPA